MTGMIQGFLGGVGKFVKYVFGLLDLCRDTLGKFWQVTSNLSL